MERFEPDSRRQLCLSEISARKRHPGEGWAEYADELLNLRKSSPRIASAVCAVATTTVLRKLSPAIVISTTVELQTSREVPATPTKGRCSNGYNCFLDSGNLSHRSLCSRVMATPVSRINVVGMPLVCLDTEPQQWHLRLGWK